jgi:ATP-binding cassette subfamily B protein
MTDDNTDIDYKALDLKLIKRLMAYLKPYKWQIFFALLITIVVSSLTPLIPYLIKISVDSYIAPGDWKGLMKMIFIIGGVLVASGVLQFGLSYLMSWVGQKVLYDIRSKLFDHVLDSSLTLFDKNPVGRLVTRVTNDIEVLNELFSAGVVMIIADLLLIFWIIGYMFSISWELTLLALVILPPLILATTLFRKKVRDTFRMIRKKVASMDSFLNEFITGIATIKLFTQEEKQKKDFDVVNVDIRDLWVKTIMYYAVFFPVVELLSAIALSIILWYAAGNVLTGIMTVGILIAFIQYIEMFFRPIRDLTEKYTTMQSAMASSERIFGLLDSKVTIPDKPDAVPMKTLSDKIEFNNVVFSYDGSKTVLKDVSFHVRKGETLAVVGATGSGKTSIINLLCRLYEFQTGEIKIDGIDIRNLKQESIRDHLCLVMQDVFLFSRSVSSNISLGDEKFSFENVKHAAMALGADKFIDNLPDGYETNIIERGGNLSAGQRQMISFCRAYIQNPDILILDEATSNIDSASEYIIEQALEKLLEGRTSIIIAHRLSTIKRASRILVLHHGRINDIGTHEELLAKNGLYAKLYHLQYKTNGLTEKAEKTLDID